MTVLFADVVHSMEIAAAVGPKRLREIMTDLIHQASVVVQQYGGTVNQFTGDGLMAVFGAPIALEDHAFRACLTALDIQREAQHLGAMEKLRLGDVDGAIQLARPTVDFLYSSGEMTTRGLAVEVLVESLLRRGPIQT